MLSPGSVIDLTIEKPAAGGRMIGRHEGQVILVHMAIPGERVRAVVERVGQGVAYATAIDVLQASPDRRTGVHDWACGGNVYSHIAYPRQLELKAQVIADALSRIGRVSRAAPVPVEPSPEAGYRMRARFHVRGRRLGFFREGTHGLCDPASTRQLLPATCEFVAALSDALSGNRRVHDHDLPFVTGDHPAAGGRLLDGQVDDGTRGQHGEVRRQK